jgi:hypothetical protein
MGRNQAPLKPGNKQFPSLCLLGCDELLRLVRFGGDKDSVVRLEHGFRKACKITRGFDAGTDHRRGNVDSTQVCGTSHSRA